MLIEDHGHQLESLFKFIDNDLFWKKFVGPYGSDSGNRRCGWTHFAPNGNSNYEWYEESSVLSDCKNWNPESLGTQTSVDCHTWPGSTCVDDEGAAWKRLWMQNIPGKDNGLSYQGKTMRDWWDFYGDFDAAVAQGRSLTS